MTKFENLSIHLIIRVSEDDAYWRHQTTVEESIDIDLPVQMFDEKKFAAVVSKQIEEAALAHRELVANQQQDIANAQAETLGDYEEEV